MKTNKGFSPILTFVIVLIVLAGGAYLYTKNQAEAPATNLEVQPQSEATSTVVDTSNWKTYKNDKYGFEFKYPESWILNEETNELFKSFGVSVADPKHPGTPYTGLPNMFKIILGGDNKCNAQNWGALGKDGTALDTGFKEVCSNHNSTPILMAMTAVTQPAKIIEDQTLSTFRFTK